MENQKKKLRLEDFTVESFVTTLHNPNGDTILGGGPYNTYLNDTCTCPYPCNVPGAADDGGGRAPTPGGTNPPPAQSADCQSAYCGPMTVEAGSVCVCSAPGQFICG